MRRHDDFGIRLHQRNWFAYFNGPEMEMGVKHHHMTKIERIRFMRRLHAQEKDGSALKWRLKQMRRSA